jgi:hypothetical protein
MLSEWPPGPRHPECYPGLWRRRPLQTIDIDTPKARSQAYRDSAIVSVVEVWAE